jgi:hypothetical protein
VPGTILRIFLPAGTAVNLLNLMEINSPKDVSLIVRIPLPGSSMNPVVATIIESFRQAGATVEVING